MHAGVPQMGHPVILTKKVLGHEVMKFHFPDSVVFSRRIQQKNQMLVYERSYSIRTKNAYMNNVIPPF